MISVERLLNERFPAFATQPALWRKPVIIGLKALLREKRINDLMAFSHGHTGLAFNDKLVEFLKVRYTATGHQHIPANGPVIIVANHPLGALDGAALIQLVNKVRTDVRMVVSDILLQFQPARSFLLPVDNLSGRSNRLNVSGIDAALDKGEAVIIFPSGEVSRASPSGIQDGVWRTGFLRVAARAKAPILPVHIGGRNTWSFYAWSMIYKPMSMLLLAREVFGNQSVHLPITIGEPLEWDVVAPLAQNLPQAAATIREHVYALTPSPAHRFSQPRRHTA